MKRKIIRKLQRKVFKLKEKFFILPHKELGRRQELDKSTILVLLIEEMGVYQEFTLHTQSLII